MKKCVVCEKELQNKNSELCETCNDFLISKYNGDLKEEIERFKETKEYLEEWRSQKSKKEVES